MKLKYIPLFLSIITCSSSFAIEVKTYNQPPVNKHEFVVEQAGQQELSKLEKNTDQIQLTTNFLGLKEFYRDTFNKQKIKDRFNDGVDKIKQDNNSTVREGGINRY